MCVGVADRQTADELASLPSGKVAAFVPFSEIEVFPKEDSEKVGVYEEIGRVRAGGSENSDC